MSITFYHLEGCPACEMTMPFWKEISKNKEKEGFGGVEFTTVESKQIPKGTDVKVFPTFHIVNRKGKKSIVEGSRESKELLAKELLKSFNQGGRRTRRRHSRRFVRRVRKTRH